MSSSHEELPATSSDSFQIDRFVVAVTAAAFLIRLLVAFAVWHTKSATWFYSQASELGELAHSVATGHGLSSPFGVNTGPSAFLPPGYPLFIGSVFAALGSFSRPSELTILIVQACFGSAAVFFTVLFARHVFGRVTANVTGMILVFHPWIIALGIVFWETSLSLMLLAALLLTVVRWRARPTAALAYIAAVLGAAAIAVNASLALTVVALLAWTAYQRRTFQRLLLVPGLIFILICSLWPLRNAFSMHAFIPLRDNLGYELWQGNRSGADGFFAPEFHPNTNGAELRSFASQGELRYMREKSTVAKQTILHDPSRFASLTGKRVFCFWAGISRQTYANQIVIASLTSLLGFAGLFMYIRRGWKSALPATLPLVLFPAPYYITHPDFRFWCLLSPLLTALSVYAFTSNVDAGRNSLSNHCETTKKKRPLSRSSSQC